MSDKLNQSLDQIMGDRRKTQQRRVRKVGTKSKAAAAPVGGIAKKQKLPEKKTVAKAVPTGPANKDSKVVVNNLPRDVSEVQIKEYFTSTVGAVKKVLLAYGPDGRSRGVATVIFSRADGAAKAVKELDGLKVDGRPMKIEVVLGADAAPLVAGPKSLSDRVEKKKATEKAKPKPATVPKPATTDKAGKPAGKGRGTRGRGGKAGRAKPKTTEELDAEMADYFTASNGADATTNGGAVQPAANGDVGMEDEVV